MSGQGSFSERLGLSAQCSHKVSRPWQRVRLSLRVLPQPTAVGRVEHTDMVMIENHGVEVAKSSPVGIKFLGASTAQPFGCIHLVPCHSPATYLGNTFWPMPGLLHSAILKMPLLPSVWGKNKHYCPFLTLVSYFSYHSDWDISINSMSFRKLFELMQVRH